MDISRKTKSAALLWDIVSVTRVYRYGQGGLIKSAVYYFFSDVFPPMHNGYKPLDPPLWYVRLFDGQRPVEGVGDTVHEEIRLNRARPDLAAGPDVR